MKFDARSGARSLWACAIPFIFVGGLLLLAWVMYAAMLAFGPAIGVATVVGVVFAGSFLIGGIRP